MDYFSPENLSETLNEVVPSWLLALCTRICATAKNSKPKYEFSQRRVWAMVQGLNATVYASSPHAQTSAFNFKFRVPAQGISIQDYWTIFGNPPDIIVSKGGDPMIYMSNKPPETGGTKDLHPARYYTYTKHKGESILWEGYLEKAIKEHIGWGAILSPAGKFTFQTLANKLAMNIADKIVNNIKKEVGKFGYTVDTGPTPLLVVEKTVTL